MRNIFTLFSILLLAGQMRSYAQPVLYGLTPQGGQGTGTISKFEAGTNTISAAYTFQSKPVTPSLYGTPVIASNGKLYGMTFEGGSFNRGVIYSIDPVNNNYTKLHDFNNTNGGNPYGSLIQASNGRLYGMTYLGGSSGYGTIFSFDPATGTHAKLHDFNFTNGGNPFGSLVQASDGKLYGMTYYGGSSGNGTIFSFDPVTGTHAKLHDFNYTNGGYPYGSLVQASDGKLYGMTYYGGSSGYGTIFSFDPATGTHAKLHDFNYTNGGYPSGSLVQASNGRLYGLTAQGGSIGYGTIFSIDPATGTHAKLHDFNYTNGGYPFGSLVQTSDGRFYGLTAQGGSGGNGTIFSFDPATGTHAKLLDFNNTNGSNPYGSLVQAGNGRLYGSTSRGGSGYYGTVFSFDPQINSHTKIFEFAHPDGINSYGSLIKANNGKFYGMNYYRGNNNYGTIYSFDPTNETYIKLHDFNYTNGGNPFGSLVQASNGKLYGMTTSGGINFQGTIFSFDPTTGTHAKLHDFNNTNGGYPYGSLVQASDGKLYGMTYYGGSFGYGTIFSFDPAAGTHAKLHDFNLTNGGYPYGSLVQSSDGKLYGMTTSGGSSGSGTIFSFDPTTGTHAKIFDFNSTNGGNPYGSLVKVSNGRLYGMTASGGSSGSGTIFSFDPTTGTHAKLFDFNYANGGNPYGSLFVSSFGLLYGMTYSGGSSGFGTVFSFDINTNTHTKLQDFNGTNGANPYIGSGFIEVNTCVPTTEVCDGVDNDCDGLIDEGVQVTFFQDNDGDGFGNPAVTIQACAAPTGYVANNTDCDDASAAKYPGATEVCDGVDNDCDGQIDEGVQSTFYQDSDGDGFGNSAVTIQACAAQSGYVADNTDCDDASAVKYPGATETCDGIDNDCDGQIDEGVLNTYYLDTDGDGYGDPAQTIQSCSAPAGYAAATGDCSDNNSALNPGATEICDGIDNDCDGQIDEGLALITWFQDSDGDGYGNPSVSVQNCGQPTGYVTNSQDCNDNNAAVNPAAAEVCNGIDDDCDGQIDENLLNTYYPDADADGFGATTGAVQACTAPAGFVSNNTDCNDGDNTIYPNAPELCDDKDNDCDGTIDDGITFVTYYRDQDGDGYGDASQSQSSCSALVGYVTQSGDCNDNNAAIKPGATEVCNGIDDDCDGQIDEGVLNTYFPDADGDGFGATTGAVQACSAPAGFVVNNTDCNDGDNTIYPNAPELCDGKDNDCDGTIDDGITFVTYYRDQDGDGYGDASQSQSSCSALVGYVTQSGDCNDNNAAIKPGATEVCNGIDDDCDGQIDEGVLNTYFPDADGDGFGATTGAVQACTAPAGFVVNNTDCNDGDNTIYPNAPELCDGKDNDCDGTIDDGITFVTYYRDQDGDGYGDASQSQSNCSALVGYVTQSGDCNDNSAAIKPGATEVCNGIDDDCDGQIDEGVLNTYFPDADGDGFGATTGAVQACSAPAGFVSSNTDCNDNSATVKPGGTEVCGNNIDDDCDGQVDEGCTTASLPKVYISSAVVVEGDNGSRNLIYTLWLNNKSTQSVSVQFQTANGTATASSDYESKSGTVTFAPNSQYQFVYVKVYGDRTYEVTENVKVNLLAPQNASLGNTSGTGTIINDDRAPSIRIEDAEATEASGMVQVKLTLSSAAGVAVSVRFDTRDVTARSPGDYSATNGQVSFLPGETVKYIPVVIKRDLLFEPSEYFKVRLSSPVNAYLDRKDVADVKILNSASSTLNTGTVGGAMDILDESTTPLQVKVLPNPSPNRFTLNLSGGSNEPIQIRVTDILGRVVEARKLPAGMQTVQVGDSWINGNYVLEITQGKERKTIQLVKMR